MSEYQRRTATERSGEAQARAVARGVVPWPNIPPGYRRGDAGRLEADPDAALVVGEAFRMRAEGATLKVVRAFLAEHGIARSYHGVGSMLASRLMLGEIHFGQLVNLQAHEPIVDTATWAAVQKVAAPRGRRAKSDRILARLGVLRCGSCGSRMVVGTANHGSYPLYRCPPTGDCKRRVTVSATLVEQIVTDSVRQALADDEGRASAARNAADAVDALERAQADLDAAIRAFVGLEGETAASDRLAELRAARDDAQAEADTQLGGSRAALTINAATDWERLSLDARRALIRAVVDRVTVAPGRGADRVTVDLLVK